MKYRLRLEAVSQGLNARLLSCTAIARNTLALLVDMDFVSKAASLAGRAADNLATSVRMVCEEGSRQYIEGS
jgi:hypothetical protein